MSVVQEKHSRFKRNRGSINEERDFVGGKEEDVESAVCLKGRKGRIERERANIMMASQNSHTSVSRPFSLM